MANEEERMLIAQAQKGDRYAFETIVYAYERTLYNYALRMLGGPEDAADAVQEAFLKAYAGLPAFRGESRLSTWLFRILNNVCVDMLRARRETVSLTAETKDGDLVDMNLPDERFNPARLVQQKELREHVRAAVERLPEEFRAPLLLREFGGQSYAEIAETMALDPGTVKTRIFGARKKLCALLAGYGNFLGKIPSKNTEGGVRT